MRFKFRATARAFPRAPPPSFLDEYRGIVNIIMVLRKSCRVWRKLKPRSVLLESKEVSDHVLLFESDVIALLSKP